ncbi:putative acyl-coenzyme A oxidase 4, peroxisomal-like isoform X1 [Capsicum annuum]|uniref:protein ZW2 n=1 Tax=Capsicum annuum TaxID=4072 RepID=UPI001FB05323|nr:protein ZW2 [Capsicum annuum]KAF3672760.1 putative acyl-coenzyme A oxidase 4, peroxisomal-like isoform X1 [Capsicum annuum]
MPRGSSRTNISAGSFEAFLQGWLRRQEEFLNELTTAQNTLDESSQNVMRHLISRVLVHYQEFFEEKSRMSHRNVFYMFSPAWFTPIEKSFLWIAGFKPGLEFSLVMNSVNDLSENQVERLNRLRVETMVEEKDLMDKLAKIQESVAAPPLMGLTQQLEIEQLRDGEIIEVNEEIEILRTAVENVVTDEDRLRTKTADSVMGILSPFLSLKFLAAAAQLQLRVRMVGTQREEERRHQTDTWNGW